MERLIASLSTLSILAFLVTWFSQGPGGLAYLLFGMSAVTIVMLLSRGYALVSKIEDRTHWFFQYTMRAHILLHLVPFSYLIVQALTKMTLTWNALYLAPVMLFFWTGRRSWRAIYDRFGSGMYQIFYRGNTGMLISCPLLLGLVALDQETFGDDIFRRLLLVYCALHFLLTGAAVVRIHKDVSAGREATPLPIYPENDISRAETQRRREKD